MLSPNFTTKEYVIEEYLFHMMAYILRGKNFWIIDMACAKVLDSLAKILAKLKKL